MSYPKLTVRAMHLLLHTAMQGMKADSLKHFLKLMPDILN